MWGEKQYSNSKTRLSSAAVHLKCIAAHAIVDFTGPNIAIPCFSNVFLTTTGCLAVEASQTV